LCAASLGSYLLRHARWRWLLRRAGSEVGWLRSFLGYLAGFAFTATPGKVGELLRVRYFGQQGVPAATVVGAFVFERAVDLVVVLVLASLSIARRDVWIGALLFVGAFLAIVVLVAWRPDVLLAVVPRLPRALARLVTLVADGLAHARRWMTVPDLIVCVAYGFAGWGLVSWAFLALLRQLTDVPVTTLQVLAMYPLAMLAGAASMLPGGIGTTEVALVALLAATGVPVAVATLAAVAIRLATLWFAIACGILSAAALEWQPRKVPSPLALPDDHPSPP
jgi:uncharacterized membrane protein YbhN (UPF0104 family)